MGVVKLDHSSQKVNDIVDYLRAGMTCVQVNSENYFQRPRESTSIRAVRNMAIELKHKSFEIIELHLGKYVDNCDIVRLIRLWMELNLKEISIYKIL